MIIQKFLDHLAIEKHYSPATVLAYGKDLGFLCEYLGVEVEAFDPTLVDEGDIKGWMLSMLDKGHQPRSIKRRLSSVSMLYRFMLQQGIVEKDVTRKIVSPKADKPLPIFFKPSEMERATAYDAQADDYPSMRDCLVIELLYQTGMRQAELVGLMDRDVDTHEGQIKVFGKRKKERVIPIGEKLCRQIEAFRVVRDDWRQEHPQKVKEGHLIDLTRSILYNIVCARMGEVSTLKKHSPHVLRHTFATTMLNNGANIREIQSLLGHASLATTQIYAHATFEQIRDTYTHSHPRAKK